MASLMVLLMPNFIVIQLDKSLECIGSKKIWLASLGFDSHNEQKPLTKDTQAATGLQAQQTTDIKKCLKMAIFLSLSQEHKRTLSHTRIQAHACTLSLSLSHKHTHSLSLTRMHSLSHTHKHSLSVRHTPHTHSLSLSLTHKHSLSVRHTHTLFLSRSLTSTQALFFSIGVFVIQKREKRIITFQPIKLL